MLNASKKFRELLNGGYRNYKLYIDMVLSDGTNLSLTNSDIWQGSFTIDDAVSSDDSFDIGSAIVNQFSFTLNNIYDNFSEYDFYGASVVAHVGLITDDTDLENPVIEKLRKGVFEVDEAKYNGATISLTCLDNMRLFDRAYSESTLSYPATLQKIVLDACDVCGVTLLNSDFQNNTFTVKNKPSDEATTFREVISWAAQIAGCFARCDGYGRLELKWYAQALLDRGGLDGGVFDDATPYASGDTADGGSFNPWDAGYVYDAGTFAEMNYHHLYESTSSEVSTDDVVITGVRVAEKVENEESGDGITYYDVGTAGYVVSIEDNSLISSGIGKKVAEYLGSKLIGMRFRKANISHLSDPTIEAGDIAFFTDRKQNTYPILVSRTVFSTGNFQNTVSSAETPQKNSDTRYSTQTKNYVENRKNTKEQISNYDKAVQMLTSLITQSFGVFKTEETLEDGSTIFYLHNKPTLAESQTIWKMTADAFAVSTDGGNTWNAGMDSSGNAVVNVLSAIGIQADWLRVTDLQAIGATIGGWKISKTQIYKTIDLYEDMSAEGLKDLGDTDPVQYWVWLRAPVNKDTWVFGICYMRKSDYLSGSNTVYRIFSATAAGVVTADSFSSANANITGGNVKIITNSATKSAVKINYDRYSSSMCAGIITVSTPEAKGEAAIYCSAGDDGAGCLTLRNNGELFCNFNSSVIYYEGNQAFFKVNTFGTTGTKSRIINTDDFGEVLQYCYETPNPMFGDIGTGQTDESGKCYIYFDPVFQETVSTDYTYCVFLQKEGKGDIWISEKTADYFLVEGTPNLAFSWEAKVKQRDYEYRRLDPLDRSQDEQDTDYEVLAAVYLANYEKEILDYEETD